MFGEVGARPPRDSDHIALKRFVPKEPAMSATAAHAVPSAPIVVPWHDLIAHRGALVRFAQRRLHDPALAEDLVHDVFEAVLCGRAVFAGRSALRSWLTGILKHKIVDLVRQRAGFVALEEDDDESGPALAGNAPRPDEVAEQRQSLAHALSRIDALPDNLRQVMRLRVLQDQSTESVCRTLAISEQNLFVRLHRARRQLMA
jgi:RNA polymerase sigma-70 factor (ECF subfamily)